jgi:putative transposase
MATIEAELKTLMVASLTGDATAHRVLLDRLSGHLRAYFKGRLARIGRSATEAEDLVQVRRALKALFGGAVGKDTVSRVWRKVKADWDAWNARSLAAEPIVRLILDGTVVDVRLDRKATAISLLVVIGELEKDRFC